MRSVSVGIFVGGQGRRMGGAAKGMLPGPGGEPLVSRWLRLCAAAAVPAVLVGDHPAYGSIPARRIPDVAPGLGPVGGLLALLHDARTRYVVTLGCDMPFVTDALLSRLLDAPDAPVVASRRDWHWDTFFARFDVASVRAAATEISRSPTRSLRPLFADATELLLSAEEAAQLVDWDTEADRLRPPP